MAVLHGDRHRLESEISMFGKNIRASLSRLFARGMKILWTGPANMATKRKRCEQDIAEELEMKRARMEDRLSNLPEDLQIRILSFLDMKQAVKTSVLSKRWVSLWTRNPVLDFDGFDIANLYVFDKFVNKVLCLGDGSAKLERLIFTRRRGTSSARILKNVFNHAFSHGVKELEGSILDSRSHAWPVCLNRNTSFESLTSLKLECQMSICCPILGPRSGSFKNLTILHLKAALITDLDPFSGFPVLDKLTLLSCDVRTEGKTLSDLTISGYRSFNCLTFTSPRLRFFEFGRTYFPLIQTTHDGCPVLETMAIEFTGDWDRMHEKRTFDDLLSLFNALPHATSLTLFPSILHILSLFQDELVKRRSPFGNLKCLNLHWRQYQHLLDRYVTWPVESFQIPSEVTAYLFQNSPRAKVTTTRVVESRWLLRRFISFLVKLFALY